MHHASTLNVPRVLYIMASPTRILQCISVSISETLRLKYCEILTGLQREHFGWTTDIDRSPNSAVPEFPNIEWGFLRSRECLVLNFGLWRSLNREITRRGKPLPPAKYIRPKIIAAWNKMKGGVDVYSAVLSHCKVDVAQLHPRARIMLHNIMTLILNCHYAWRLLQVEDSLLSCSSFWRFREKLKSSMSFDRFLWNAVHENFSIVERSLPTEPNLDPEFSKDLSLRKKRRRSKAYFNSEEGREERQSGAHVPRKISSKNARYCRYCSMTTNERQTGGGRVIKRTGRRARTECSKCLVTLCTSLPGNSSDRRTCFEKWHSRRVV